MWQTINIILDLQQLQKFYNTNKFHGSMMQKQQASGVEKKNTCCSIVGKGMFRKYLEGKENGALFLFEIWGRKKSN